LEIPSRASSLRSAVHFDCIDSHLRRRGKSSLKAHLGKGVRSAGHQPFAAELPREVGLALQEDDSDAAAGEQIRERGARRPGARDQDLHRAHELEVTERQPVLHHGISFLLR
jgi:hypothetical protein